MAARPDIMGTIFVFDLKNEQKKKKATPYNITVGELTEEIEKKPELIHIVIGILRAYKDEYPVEFGNWLDKLKIDPALKENASEKIGAVLGHKFEDQVVRALGIVVKYNIPSVLFRFEDTLYKEIPVGINEWEIKKRTAMESKSDIKEILANSGWSRVPTAVVLAVKNSVYGIPRLKGITSKPIVRDDGSICTKAGFDNESRWYYQPSSEDEVSVEGFLREWYEALGDKEESSREIVDWIRSKPEMKMPEEIHEAMERPNQVIALGKVLKEMQKKEFENDLQLVMIKDRHTKANRYKVLKNLST